MISENILISNFIKIRPVGAELFRANGRERRMDGRTDGQTDMSKLTVSFRNLANAPKMYFSFLFLNVNLISFTNISDKFR
jgi:hypothetical protein